MRFLCGKEKQELSLRPFIDYRLQVQFMTLVSIRWTGNLFIAT